MKKAKKSNKSTKGAVPQREDLRAVMFSTAGTKIENGLNDVARAFQGICDELHGIREEIARSRGNNAELEASVGRLGQRIGEFIEHQFHSVK